ncbi:MAG: hypothetical protein LBN24_05695 [Mediterranea sp.]|nr:hypothetical protein [Mediterranea sp.]
MKRMMMNIKTLAILATVTSMAACSSDDSNRTENKGGDKEGDKPVSSIVQSGNLLSGTLTAEETLESKEYILNGTVVIAEGGRLNIPAGTTIKAKEGFSSYLLVAQGGQLFADGTAEKPIVFTANSGTPKAGFWGGIILNGRAPISGEKADKSDTGLTEIDNAYKYGGDKANDNSGSLSYVQILYAGARSTADIEHNGLTLNGVGNGTRIENIYVFESADDGIEFFGGTVNVKNLLVVNPDDDMFDFTQGYCGTLTNCYGVWESGYTSTESDPRGVEADGNLDGAYPTHLRQSDFRIENMTIVNNAAGTTDNVDRMQDVVKIRRGAKATIVNALVKGTGSATDLIDLNDSKGSGNPDSSISLTNHLNIVGKELNGTLNTPWQAAGNTGADASLFSWTGYNLPAL